MHDVEVRVGDDWIRGVFVGTHIVNVFGLDAPSGVVQEVVGVVLLPNGSGYVKMANIRLITGEATTDD